MGAPTSRRTIYKHRSRRRKIDILRKHYTEAKTEAERNAVIKKAQKISRQMLAEEFLMPLQRKPRVA